MRDLTASLLGDVAYNVQGSWRACQKRSSTRSLVGASTGWVLFNGRRARASGSFLGAEVSAPSFVTIKLCFRAPPGSYLFATSMAVRWRAGASIQEERDGWRSGGLRPMPVKANLAYIHGGLMQCNWYVVARHRQGTRYHLQGLLSQTCSLHVCWFHLIAEVRKHSCAETRLRNSCKVVHHLWMSGFVCKFALGPGGPRRIPRRANHTTWHWLAGFIIRNAP